MNKRETREMYLQKRNSLSRNVVGELSAKIEEHILGLVQECGAQVILAYAAFRNEPETLSLLEKLILKGKTVGLPRCGKNGKMTMYRVTDIDSLQKGAYGILEPAVGEVVLPEQADLVLVPGCSFSRGMERLGYGGGYYDRYLAECTRALKVGVCYEMCVSEVLPVDEFDIKMDCLLTENGLVKKV